MAPPVPKEEAIRQVNEVADTLKELLAAYPNIVISRDDDHEGSFILVYYQYYEKEPNSLGKETGFQSIGTTCISN